MIRCPRDLPLLLLWLGLFAVTPLRAATPGAGDHAPVAPWTVPKLNPPTIRIDGRLDEPVWQELPALSDMRVLVPDLLTEPRYRTETRLFYTDRGLYVGISAEQDRDTLLPRLSPRDADVNRDGTMFFLDTSGQGHYGIFTGVALGGTLTDGTLLAERHISKLWDGAWYGESATTDKGYTTEMFLPWSMMQMPKLAGPRTMGFYVTRHVASLGEDWGWPILPSTQPQFISAFQPLTFADIRPRQQLALYPFAAASHDHMRDEDDTRVGADIFWRPSSNLQLTATLHPDFGNVESDDVVVNLTAFETFFPEKRPFFLEGNEIFVTSPRSVVIGAKTSGGARPTPNFFFLEPMTLVNTRRIGGAAIAPESCPDPPDPTQAPCDPNSAGRIPPGVTLAGVELSKPSELDGAMKLTGELGRIRYGVLAASEDDTTYFGTDTAGAEVQVRQTGRDFGIARMLYESAGPGRRSIGFISTIVAHDSGDARTQGIDGHYRSARGNIFWDGQLMRSDVDGIVGRGGFVDINYIQSQGQYHKLSLDYLGEHLDVSDLGYIRRNDEITFRYIYSRSRSDLEHLRGRNNTLTLSYLTNTDHQVTRANVWYRHARTYHNKNQLTLTGMYLVPAWDDRLSRGNGTFRVKEGFVGEIAYGTDTSNKLSTSVGLNAMTEALGDWSYTLKGGFTFKPSDRFSIDVDASYRISPNWLIHVAGRTTATYRTRHVQPSITADMFLTARQQLRFSLQWVGINAEAERLYQVPLRDGDLIALPVVDPSPYDFTISRMTAQLRYRWEIAPMSDLFAVYTRGSNLPNRRRDSFGDLFHDSVTDPIIDLFVIKLRYRFGR